MVTPFKFLHLAFVLFRMIYIYGWILKHWWRHFTAVFAWILIQLGAVWNIMSSLFVLMESTHRREPSPSNIYRLVTQHSQRLIMNHDHHRLSLLTVKLELSSSSCKDFFLQYSTPFTPPTFPSNPYC